MFNSIDKFQLPQLVKLSEHKNFNYVAHYPHMLPHSITVRQEASLLSDTPRIAGMIFRGVMNDLTTY